MHATGQLRVEVYVLKEVVTSVVIGRGISATVAVA